MIYNNKSKNSYVDNICKMKDGHNIGGWIILIILILLTAIMYGVNIIYPNPEKISNKISDKLDIGIKVSVGNMAIPFIVFMAVSSIIAIAKEKSKFIDILVGIIFISVMAQLITLIGLCIYIIC